MMKSRFSEEQIIGFLKQADAGMPIKEAAAGQGGDGPLVARLQRGPPAQQLPTDAARQARRIESAEFCRFNATHNQRNPLTLQPDFLPNDWHG